MKAWELLSDRNRWQQGTFENNGRYCAFSAIELCYPHRFDRLKVVEKLQSHIAGRSIVLWNDFSTYTEVHRVLKELDI